MTTCGKNQKHPENIENEHYHKKEQNYGESGHVDHPEGEIPDAAGDQIVEEPVSREEPEADHPET